jgi:hypothetical protein
MNIHTVAENLRNTIAGKEALLEEYKKASLIAVRNDTPDRVTIGAMAGFLSTNIDELKRILQDVEVCAKKESDDSWITNPDRSGGQFTQDEIYNMDRGGWIEP